MLRTLPMLCLAALGGAWLPWRTAAAEGQTGFDLQIDAAYASIHWQGAPVLKYRFGDAPPKPYVRELHTPGGTQILRDSPADHVHHRGLMYGVFLEGVDFWSELPGAGKQIHVSIQGQADQAPGGLAHCRLEQRVEWVAADKRLAIERRTIEVWAGDGIPATLLSWRTRLEPSAELNALQVTGSHYDGLGIRFVESMDGVGRFFNPTGDPGKLVRGTERVVPANWCAYTAPVGQKPVTIALFDHPANVRHPAGMFTMLQPFAYLSATPNVWNNPLPIERGSAVDWIYGVALWDGETRPAAIAELYQRWIRLAQR